MPTAHPEYRSLLVVDIMGFSSRERTDRVRLRLHQRLRRFCGAELKRIGADDADWYSNDTGDGFVFSITPSIPKSKLLDMLIPKLSTRLERDNLKRPASEQIRLRASIHAGEVLRDPEPLHGEAVIHAFRLLDSAALRRCLRTTQRPLALIVSQIIYESIVRQRYIRLEPAAFRPVIAAVKETQERAWVHVPGDDGAPLRAGVVVTEAQASQLGRPEPPQELPGTAPGFTARQRELDRLDELLGGARDSAGVTVVVITGIGGVGKSALAIQAAHRLAGRFPDGQLYIDLQGASPHLAPLAPLVALQHFLRSLGLDEADLPTTLESAVSRYRSMVADQRILILLDNAKDAAQLRRLLPDSHSCGVLITSRRIPGDLKGAFHLPLGVLSPADAVELLRQLVEPGRIGQEHSAASEIASACGYLPLALRIAAARLRDRPTWKLSTLANRLADEHRRLDRLRVGDLAVRASLEVSYQDLTARGQTSSAHNSLDPARAFRLLGLLGGPDIGVSTAAALLESSEAETETTLEQLVDENLLENPAPDRYRFHDLLRLLAHHHALEDLSDAEQDAAYLRLLAFYCQWVEAADRLLRRGRNETVTHGPARSGLHDQDAALRWLEIERPNILAFVRRAAALPRIPPGMIGRLADALSLFLRLRSHLVDAEQVGQAVLEIALIGEDRRTEALGRNQLGLIAWGRYRLSEAISAFEQSLALFRNVGDRQGEERILSNLGMVHQQQRHYDKARTYLEASLRICRELGDQLSAGQTLGNLGIVHRLQGRHDEALSCHRRSLAICREFGDRNGQSSALNGIGRLLHDKGEYSEAIDCYQQDLVICQELGDRQGAGTTLHHLGDAEHSRGQTTTAVKYYLRSLDLHRAVGNRWGEAETLKCLGKALQALGHGEQAAACWQDALGIYDHLNAPEAVDVRMLLDTQIDRPGQWSG